MMTSTPTRKDAHGLRKLSPNCGICYSLFGYIAIRVCTTQMPSILSTVWNIFALLVLLRQNCLLVLAFFRTCTALISPPTPPLSCCPNQFIFLNAGYYLLFVPLANDFNRSTGLLLWWCTTTALDWPPRPVWCSYMSAPPPLLFFTSAMLRTPNRYLYFT